LGAGIGQGSQWALRELCRTQTMAKVVKLERSEVGRLGLVKGSL